MEEHKQIVKIGLLVSCACVLQVAESLLPHPVPGARLGLANMITLVALVTSGFGVALQIALMRTLISSLILGTFLSPSFMLSFSGALVSTLVMGIFYKLSTSGHRVRFSIIGISVFGSLSHNAAQLGLVYLLLVKNRSVFLLWPWLVISGVIMGWITGMIAMQVCRKLATSSSERAGEGNWPDIASVPGGRYDRQSSPIHLLSAPTKIVGLIVIAVVVLLSKRHWFHISLFGLLVVLAIFSRIRLVSLFSGVGKVSSLLFLSFLLPSILTPGKVLSSVGPLQVTSEGLLAGVSMASRIVLLFMAASLLALTTSPRDMALGLQKLLSPLKIFKLSVNRLAHVLTVSWTFFPVFWRQASSMIQNQDFGWRKMTNFVDFSSTLIARLYQWADHISEDTASSLNDVYNGGQGEDS